MTVTLDTDEERITVPCIQTYRWKEKLAILMLPRIQGSLQRTKTLTLKPGKIYVNLSEHFTKASMQLLTEIFSKFHELQAAVNFENILSRQIWLLF